MLITFDSTETVNVEYIHPDVIREWLLANDWVQTRATSKFDYWEIWHMKGQHLHWVQLPNLPGTYGDQLSDQNRCEDQGDLFERLERFHDKPAKAIWQDMFRNQQKKVNDVG